MAQKFFGKVVKKRQLTYDIVGLRIELLDPKIIEFIAGQYIRFESEPYVDKPAVTRTYSMGSIPSDNRHIELTIRRVQNGICTTWVFDHLKEGQAVRFAGPYGKFYLRDTKAPCIFIAGGSGMGPIKSILNDMKEKGVGRKSVFFFGAVTQKDLYYIDEMKNLEKELPDFTFISALSAEPFDSGWQGERGLITDVVARHFPALAGWEAYLCGSPGMLNACITVLSKAGIPQTSIFYDKFEPRQSI